MAKKRAKADQTEKRSAGDGTEDLALDFRHHHARRPNNPTAANAAEGRVEPTMRHAYSYDPHRPPTLRFDDTGRADRDTDRAAELLGAARERTLSDSEADELSAMLRQGQPWLE